MKLFSWKRVSESYSDNLKAAPRTKIQNGWGEGEGKNNRGQKR
jgi:hypothetical protein